MSRSWYSQHLAQSSSPLRTPPPVASTVLPPPPSRPRRSHQLHDPLTPLHRQSRSLEHTLQSLLDAQADGLLAGLRGAPVSPDLAASTTANTSMNASFATAPTSSSSRILSSSRVLPIRQPEERPLSLAQARRSIWDTMRRLSTLKVHEAEVLGHALAEDEDTVARIDGWIAKREGLETEMDGVRADGSGARAEALREEDGALGAEIQAVEVRLAELKSQQRAVRHELQTLENGVQARLSSYRESARMLEREVETFLKSPPTSLPPLAATGDAKGKGRVDTDSYLTLPANRRTLEMARDYVFAERSAAEARLRSVEAEQEALAEGANMWNEVIGEVSAFERTLRQRIRNLGRQEGDAGSHQDRDEVLRKMDETLDSVQTKVAVAETKSWNLLMVAVGAELDALTQGRDMLREALGDERRPASHVGDPETGSTTSQDTATGPQRKMGDGVESPEPEQSSPVIRSAVLDSPETKAAPRPVHLEDEPDPELLISSP